MFQHTSGPIADFGCGEGLLSEAAVTYVGLDLVYETLRKADLSNPRSIAADICFVPLKDASCGGVICVNTLHMAANPWRVLIEMHRVLRPQGVIYLKNDWFKPRFGRANRWLRAWSRIYARTAFLWHRLSSPERFAALAGSRGWALCPHCVAGFLTTRGYRVTFPENYVIVAVKEASLRSP